MILVDSSVWIAFFNGHATPETDCLDRLLGSEPLLIGDFILAKVLQGFRRDADYGQAKALMDTLELRVLGGKDVAVTAADNFRRLRRAGRTIRRRGPSLIAASRRPACPDPTATGH